MRMLALKSQTLNSYRTRQRHAPPQKFANGCTATPDSSAGRVTRPTEFGLFLSRDEQRHVIHRPMAVPDVEIDRGFQDGSDVLLG